jgi:hypothetical protein
MAEVLAVPETTDEQQLQIVAKCMSFVPQNMNIKEGYSLMTILDKVGLVDAHLAAVEGRRVKYERTIKIQKGRIKSQCLVVRSSHRDGGKTGY